MKLNELITDIRQGIFTAVFAPNYPDAFNVIFGDVGAITADTLTLMQFGNREVVSYVTPDNYKDYVNAIIDVNVSDWVRIGETLATPYDVLNPTVETVTHKETVSADENGTNESLTANKSYNDETFTDNDRQADTRQTDRQETRDYTTIKSGLGNSKDFADVVQKEIQLRRDNWKKSVIFAIVKEITKAIY